MPLLLPLLIALTLQAGAKADRAKQTPKPPAANAQVAVGAGTDLMITTRRVVFQGPKRNSEISIMNTGAKLHTYRISVNYRDMDDQGRMTERNEPKAGERPWQDLIRFAPRQVTLGPGEDQVVRISVRKPADLPELEYRYYLNFQLLPQAGDPANVTAPPQGISFDIQPVYGLAIPVIFRNGNLRGTAGLADLALQPAQSGKPATFTFHLTRAGNASIYGHVMATFVPRSGGMAEEVGGVKGLAVYTDQSQRLVRLPIQRPGGEPLRAGRLHLTFTPDGARSAEIQADLELP